MPSAKSSPVPADKENIGQTVSEIADDLSRLMRQELELARAELRQEAKTAGKAAGLLGGGGFAGWMAAIVGSFALVFALAGIEDLGLAWSAAIVAAIWAVLAAVLAAMGRSELKKVGPPQQTIDSLKEDKQWAKTQMK